MMIAIRCDAGKDDRGTERRTTLYINQNGNIQDAMVGWPDQFEDGIECGPILRVTPEEYIFQCQVSTGSGV